jgi:hypothetical protein
MDCGGYTLGSNADGKRGVDCTSLGDGSVYCLAGKCHTRSEMSEYVKSFRSLTVSR